MKMTNEDEAWTASILVESTQMLKTSADDNTESDREMSRTFFDCISDSSRVHWGCTSMHQGKPGVAIARIPVLFSNSKGATS